MKINTQMRRDDINRRANRDENNVDWDETIDNNLSF